MKARQDIRFAILSFALGIWLLQQQAALPAYAWLALLPFIFLTAWLSQRHFVLIGVLSSYVGYFILGFYWAAILADLRLKDELPREWEGRDIVIVGVVANLPEDRDGSLRLKLDVEQVLTEGASVPRHVLLSNYRKNRYTGHEESLASFLPGERWQLTVRLKRPHGSGNPHVFDYEAWLLEQNIRATGYIRKGGQARLDDQVASPAYLVARARQHIAQRISEALPAHPYQGIIKALAIGDQSGIPQAQWQLFLRTGINHLVSISGLHITMLSGLAFAVVYWLWRRSPWLTQWLAARRAASLFGLLVALTYSLLAGFAIPAQRTLYMLMVIALALWAARIPRASLVLSLALLVVVVVDPWAVSAPGFWLSFAAVALIFYASLHRMARPHWLQEWLTVQWVITLGLVPLLLILFQQFSLVSPLANALAIPLISLVVVPLTLLGAILPWDGILELAHHVLGFCILGLEYLNRLPTVVWQQHAPSLWAVLLAIISLVWLFLPSGFPARWLGLVGLLPLFTVLPSKPPPGAFWLTVLDVGQGLSAVIRTQHHAVVYDTGPPYSATADSGNRVIAPFLRGMGIHELDGVIVSHNDNDHSGGAASLLKEVPAKWLLSTLPHDHALRTLSRNPIACYAGLTWAWDGVRFDILHPQAESAAQDWLKDNARGCVLKVSASSGSALLPADIERDVEQSLLQRLGPQLASTLIIAPHHGSKTSSSIDFIRQVNPAAVIYAVGYRNHFRHPRSEITERYQVLGSKGFRTDEDGAVTVYFEGKEAPRLHTHRGQAQRYWHEY